jgi:hypothetical protein
MAAYERQRLFLSIKERIELFIIGNVNKYQTPGCVKFSSKISDSPQRPAGIAFQGLKDN